MILFMVEIQGGISATTIVGECWTAWQTGRHSLVIKYGNENHTFESLSDNWVSLYRLCSWGLEVQPGEC